MTREKIERELDRLTLELARVELMSEKQACEFCNTDSKAEAIEAYETEIALFKMDLQELDEEDARASIEDNGGLDPAFSSWSQVLGMFYNCKK